MKAIKYFLLILFCQCCALAYPQQTTDEVDSIIAAASLKVQKQIIASLPDSILARVPAIRKQVEEWKQKTIENPKDEMSWISYVTTFRALEALTLNEKAAQEKAEIVNRMQQSIPNTATYAILEGIIIEPGKKRPMDIEEVMEKWPDAVLHYPTYMSIMVTRGGDKLKDLAIRWYKSGTFPPEALNFAYNLLASADKNALIFVSANTDSFGCYILQLAKEMFKDKRIIVLPHMLTPTNMKQLTEELGIPEFKEERPDFSKTESIMTAYYDSFTKQVNHLIKYSQRPVYFSISTLEPMRNLFKDHLHAEGLLMKYAEKPYDNLAIMRRNFESTYLLDYVKETFYPEIMATTLLDNKAAETLNLYYIPGFRSLLQFYKESDDQTHYDELYQLLSTIVRNAKFATEADREKYLKSINFQ